MSTSYIPARDADLANWALNFATLITASPATYGLVSGDAAAITSVQTSYSTAYGLAVNPSTKTKTTVANKNVAKVNLLATVRPYAQTIVLNAGVSSANKLALGLNPHTSTPTPVPTPTTNPVLTLNEAFTLQHLIRYRDTTASPSVKSKPAGAIACQIYSLVSATPVTDPTKLLLVKNLTKTPALIDLDSGDVGKQCYYAARWVTRTGLLGPWSPIVNFTVAG